MRRFIVAIGVAVALASSGSATQQDSDRTGGASDVRIPAAGFDCTTGSFNPPIGVSLDPVLALAIANGKQSRNVIVQTSAENSVPAGGLLRILYSIDGGAPVVRGPEFFSHDAGTDQTRTAIAVIPLGPGNHTIRIAWGYSGPAGSSGHVHFRCATAEGRTQ